MKYSEQKPFSDEAIRAALCQIREQLESSGRLLNAIKFNCLDVSASNPDYVRIDDVTKCVRVLADEVQTLIQESRGIASNKEVSA